MTLEYLKKELDRCLKYVPGMIHSSGHPLWDTINMDKEVPIIQRLFMKVERVGNPFSTPFGDPFESNLVLNYRLCLNKILHSNEEHLWHNHSWNFAVKMIKGSYEMGIGHSKDGETPEVSEVKIIGPGDTYVMSGDQWHYTKPLTEATYSVMLIDDNSRWKPQYCHFEELDLETKLGVLKEFYELIGAKDQFEGDILNGMD